MDHHRLPALARRFAPLLLAAAGLGTGALGLGAPANANTADLMRLLEQRRCVGCQLADADLVHANLRDADLSGANLRRANLGQAQLDGARLAGADLSFTSLQGASLRGADLRGARLEGTDLSGANLIDAVGLPIVDDAPQRLLAVATTVLGDGATLAMGNWHTCDTTHCLAGWAIHQAGTIGKTLESLHGPHMAGLLLLGHEAAGHFYDSNKDAIKWLRSVVDKS